MVCLKCDYDDQKHRILQTLLLNLHMIMEATIKVARVWSKLRLRIMVTHLSDNIEVEREIQICGDLWRIIMKIMLAQAHGMRILDL